MSGNDSYTKSLLHMNGIDGSVVFTDSASGGIHVWTARGTAQIDTAQSQFGGASGLFDGDSDWIDTPDSADWNFGTGDFTIDFWIRFNVLPSAGNLQVIMTQYVDAANQLDIYLYNNAGTYEWRFHIDNGATTTYMNRNSPGLSTGTWYHFAVSRSGTTFRIFQNGTQCGTDFISSNPVPDFAGLLYIGKFGTYATPYYFNGWIDEFRISKGIARWTVDFTPPTTEYSLDISEADFVSLPDIYFPNPYFISKAIQAGTFFYDTLNLPETFFINEWESKLPDVYFLNPCVNPAIRAGSFFYTSLAAFAPPITMSFVQWLD